MARRRRTLLVVLGIVCVLGAGASAVALLGNLDMTGEARASESWPSTPGTVLSSKVVKQGGRGSHFYEVLATYDYEVAGLVHHGNRIGFYREGNFEDASDANAFVAHYKPGARVDVYYDPGAPDDAVLVRGGQHTGFAAIALFAGVGVGFLVAAIACFLRARRQ